MAEITHFSVFLFSLIFAMKLFKSCELKVWGFSISTKWWCSLQHFSHKLTLQDSQYASNFLLCSRQVQSIRLFWTLNIDKHFSKCSDEHTGHIIFLQTEQI